jgi:hypothetical protein
MKELKHAFRIGDIVKVVKGGLGIHPSDVGLKCIITDCGKYHNAFNDYRDLGYKIQPISNITITTSINEKYISEGSFELIEPIDKITQTTITNNNKTMSKAKTLVKKVTQDVRVIETSLINKEEVFKMLALAESTGLPCLLVGAPGVNSK